MSEYRVVRAGRDGGGVSVDVNGQTHIVVTLSHPFEGLFAEMLTDAVRSVGPATYSERVLLGVEGTGYTNQVVIKARAGQEDSALSLFAKVVTETGTTYEARLARQVKEQEAATKTVAAWNEGWQRQDR